MPKYEEILIKEYGDLSCRKKDLINKIDDIISRMLRLKSIDASVKKKDLFFLRWICFAQKIKQLIRLENRSKLRFKELADEFWPIEKRLVEIRTTLFKYYDEEIKECIDELGIENIDSLEGLLILKNDKFKEHIDREDS